MSDFYVYEYRLQNAEYPFYVGKGNRNRMNFHSNKAKKMQLTQNRFITYLQELRVAGVKPIVQKTHEGLSDIEALTIEEQLIVEYGRIGYEEGGKLYNVQRKGTFWRHTEETKAKIQASAKDCIADGRMKTWATSLTKEGRAQNVTKGNKSRAKPLYAYSQVDGSFLKEFPPYNETVELLQVKTAHLSLALKDRCFSCGGYLWSHERLDNLGITEKDVAGRSNRMSKPKHAKAIIQTFPDGTKKTWESMSAVIREMGGHARMIDKIIATGSQWHACTWSR